MSLEPVLIGRTRINIDNYDVDTSNIDYSKIKCLVEKFIIDNKISVLPIDVIDIATRNNWVVVPYSNISESILDIYEEIMYTDWGFTVYYNGKYFIFYNNSIKIGSQRFTIAHEIGHIVLDHFECSDTTTREIEANDFAAKLLMPLDIINGCKISSNEELASLCGVSLSAASYGLKRLEKNRNRKSKLNNVRNEIIQKQFKNFIKKYLNKKSEFKDDK